jgi:hypothetical protein
LHDHSNKASKEASKVRGVSEAKQWMEKHLAGDDRSRKIYQAARQQLYTCAWIFELELSIVVSHSSFVLI